MGTLRTRESEQAYREAIANGHLENGCRLCELEPLRSWKHWKLVVNIFPYDLIAKTHHMLLPLRHVSYVDLLPEERSELDEIKEAYLHSEYEWIIEAAKKRQSIPSHFHLHCIIGKD